ncbi:hypothetical protein [Pseudomonas sp. W15Feb9B]|uniref:SLOG domain-containing protein n=1 Tax=Pseudomonas sp. W15Feb9B TaxID=550743 RepID=UPI000696BD91|nr:hypothetical protein [Pseudomonas sp. W15Feb9B]
MKNAIFLSASIPDPLRSPEYAATADSVAIVAAVTALIHVTLGRRPLVWGGHPAITPMIFVAAESLGVEYGDWVKLYQSNHFVDEFPEDNEKFNNVVYVPAKENLQQSLLHMREQMFARESYSAAVFIGGMEGIVDEFDLFSKYHPKAKIIPIASSGGAARKVAERLPREQLNQDLALDLDYVALLHRHLDISNKEKRYRNIKDQPRHLERRMWRKSDPRRDPEPGPGMG